MKSFWLNLVLVLSSILLSSLGLLLQELEADIVFKAYENKIVQEQCRKVQV